MTIRFCALAGLLIAAPSAPAWAADGERPWTLSVSGGSTILDGSGGQPFVSVAIGRSFGDSYVRLAGTYVDSAEGDTALSTIPAETKQLTLSAGTTTGALSIDGYASIGDRNFQPRVFTTRTGQTITLDTNGSSWGAGLSLSYDVPVSDNVVLAPFVSGDYSRIDIARAVTLPQAGTVGEKSAQDGFTGTAGLSASRLFGARQQHSIGLYGALLVSSNSTAYNGTNAQRASALGLGDQPGSSDEWAEYGIIAAFGLSDSLTLDVGAIRTAGFAGDESTSLTAGLSVRF